MRWRQFALIMVYTILVFVVGFIMGSAITIRTMKLYSIEPVGVEVFGQYYLHNEK